MKTKIVQPEDLNRSDLRAQAHFPKEPSPEMTIVDLRAKLSLWPDVEPHILKAYFEYAFEDVDSWDDLTKGERRVLTPETFTRIREWAFGKEEPSAAGL